MALLRVLLIVLKISRFSLDQTRLSDGSDKRSLLRAIDQARSALPLPSVLRIARGQETATSVKARQDLHLQPVELPRFGRRVVRRRRIEVFSVEQRELFQDLGIDPRRFLPQPPTLLR